MELRATTFLATAGNRNSASLLADPFHTPINQLLVDYNLVLYSCEGIGSASVCRLLRLTGSTIN